MLQFLMCLFGLQGVTEFDYTVDDEKNQSVSGLFEGTYVMNSQKTYD